MRRAFYFVIGMFVIISVYYVYTEMDLRRFEKTLPDHPTLGQDSRMKLRKEQQSSENGKELATQPRVADKQVKQEHNSTTVMPSMDAQQVQTVEKIKASLPNKPISNGSLGDALKSEPKEQTVEEEPHFSEIPVEALIERNRKLMIKKYGDIPEIDIFLKHFPFAAMQQAKDGHQVTRTQAENLEYLRAISALFPSKINDKNYQDALRDAKEVQVTH